MNRLRVLFLFCITLSAALAQPPGKKESRYGFEIDYRPTIYYDFYTTLVAADRNPHINLVIHVQNDLFQFTSTDKGYTAAYEVTVTIKNEPGNQAVFANVWKKTITVEDFKLTNSRSEYQVVQEGFDPELSDGKYRLFLEVLDSGTGKGYRNSRPLEIFSKRQYSEIKLFSLADNLPAEILPGPMDPLVEFNQDIKTLLQLNSQAGDSIIITSKLLSVDEEKKSIVRQRIYREQAKEERFTFSENISQKYLDEGYYLLRYRVRFPEETVNLEKRFQIVWFEKPVYLYKYDLALRPMIYLLSEEEWEQADGLSYDELGVWMKDYWGSKDPTPETQLNEIQVEFFRRVDQANQKYSQRFTEGWETDRGKSLILYGEPDRIDANPYAINSKPYEIWYYDKIATKLTFIDQYKEDNYKLVSVESYEEKIDE